LSGECRANVGSLYAIASDNYFRGILTQVIHGCVALYDLHFRTNAAFNGSESAGNLQQICFPRVQLLQAKPATLVVSGYFGKCAAATAVQGHEVGEIRVADYFEYLPGL
jgi:hypothetical protein